MTWVLMVFWYMNGDPAATSAIFQTKELCEKAVAQFDEINKLPPYKSKGHFQAYCFQAK